MQTERTPPQREKIPAGEYAIVVGQPAALWRYDRSGEPFREEHPKWRFVDEIELTDRPRAAYSGVRFGVEDARVVMYCADITPSEK